MGLHSCIFGVDVVMLFLHRLAVRVYRGTCMNGTLRIYKSVVVAIHWTVWIAGGVKWALSM